MAAIMTLGWPVVGAPACVTVAADTCVQAGVFATFAMLEGRDAEVFLQEERVRHWITRH
jgi:thiamine biosynthesis lipoprotein